MASIWDDDESPTQSSEQLQQAVVKKDSAAEIDLLDREAVTKETNNLFDSLMICDGIVVTAYKITDYLPVLTNSEMKQFWNNEIIPTLVKIVQQDVQARSVVWQSFSSIRNLAICINEGAGLVKELKGSSTAIQIAQKTISPALDNLKASIAAASELSANALTSFEDKINTLFRIMGQKTADYVNRKVDIHRQLEEKYKKKKELMDEMSRQKELLEIYNNMIHVTQSKIIGAKEAIEETKCRSRELASLNDKIEKKFNDIPPTYHVREAHPSGIPWFGNSHSMANPNRDVEKQFYLSLVNERVARIKANNEEANQQQAVRDELTASLVDYQAKYVSARDRMQDYERTFYEQMKILQREIDDLRQQLNDISMSEATTANQMGLQGQNLEEFLKLVTTLKADVHKGANAYKPLEAALTATRAMVESHIMLLQEGSDIEVYAAGVKLLHKVSWLQEYHTSACKQLKTSNEYNAIQMRHTLNALEIS